MLSLGAKVLADEVDLSSGELKIPEQVADAVQEGKDLEVRVRLPSLAEGSLKLRKHGAAFNSDGARAILLRHPALAKFSAANPTVLALTVKENKVSGFVGLGTPGPVKGSNRSLIDAMAKGVDLLNWTGLSNLRFPATRNRFQDGAIDLGVDNLSFTVGGFLSGTGSVALDNKALSFDGSAKITIPGGSSGELLIRKDPTGALSGKLDILVALGSVAGTVTATMSNGFVSIMGQVGYSGDRLSGKVTLVATDEATARDITLAKPTAGGDVPIELPGPDKPAKPGKRAFCGWGQLTFRITDWLAGAATVIINSKGQATIVGEIAPPKEFILFPQKEWERRLFKLEIKAGYGIPVVGQVGVYANISLSAVATVGPGKLYNIKLSGVYSTDPRVAKNLTIEGTLNISAFAGLKLRAEAGLFVTILAHDIKVGAGMNAIAGVRGYVEATPRIGMREKAPGGKREYFIQGHLEIAAQPVLGFSGDLFVKVETPWWSPLSDKTWTWPLFSLEYPLPGEFGIGADVDYVLGSKQWPSIQFGEVNFDSSKFMTDVMNDNTDKGSGAEKKKQGDWVEGLGAKGKGGAKNKGGAAKGAGAEEGDDIGPIGEEMPFSDGRESHRLWIDEKNANSTTMLASDGGKIQGTFGTWGEKFKIALAADAIKAQALIARARQQADNLDKLADDLVHRKQAAKNARAYYKEYGGRKKGGGKGDKSKSKKDLKRAKAEVRGAQRALEKTVEELAKVIVTMPFLPIARPANMHGGTEKVEIVAQGNAAAIHVAGNELKTIFARLLGGPIGNAINKAAERFVRQAWNDLDAIGKEIGKTLLKGGQVNVRAYQPLLKKIGPIGAVVSRVGRQLRIENLPRARLVKPLEPKTPVAFTAKPKSPENNLYSAQFIVELERQLRDQQRHLNQITVDRWFANLALFKINHAVYQELDRSARKFVRDKLIERAKAARDRTERTLRRTEKKLEEILARGTQHGFQSDIISRRLRAEQRREAIEAALRELARAEKEDDMPLPELVRPVYPGVVRRDRQGAAIPVKMDVRIAGRQGAERKERRRYVNDLIDLIKDNGEWSQLAKDGRELAILHRPDQVAGGYDRFERLERPPAGEASPDWKKYLANLRKMFGPADVNSNIGKEWTKRIASVIESVRKQVATHEAQPINRLNLVLSVQGGA
jgi:hypothetical protein